MTQQSYVSCDEVFDRLTQVEGSSCVVTSQITVDSRIQAHLDTCPACRELAESLLPAVNLLATAIAHPAIRDEAINHRSGIASNDLSEQGRGATRGSRSSLRRVPWQRKESSTQHPDEKASSQAWLRFGQTLAVMLACVGLAICFAMALQPSSSVVAVEAGDGRDFEPIREGQPSADGWRQLHQLTVNKACWASTEWSALGSEQQTGQAAEQVVQELAAHFRTGTEPASTGQDATIYCCTECHSAGSQVRVASVRAVQRLRQSCALCHTWPASP